MPQTIPGQNGFAKALVTAGASAEQAGARANDRKSTSLYPSIPCYLLLCQKPHCLPLSLSY